MIMEPHLRALLEEVREWGLANDAVQQERAKKMLNLQPDTAMLISILVRSGKRTRVLEIGTSNGYSTIWLAWSVSILGGRVVSIDRNPDKVAMAHANLERAGLRHLVDLRHGDATQVVATLSGPFDFVFFDADRLSAPAQLNLLLPKLTDDALVLADNALSHPEDSKAYLAAIAAMEAFDHVVIPVGKGLSIAYKSGSTRPT
jgi:predicted O-methyltransferase YrrM